MRVCAVQMPHGETLEDNLSRARALARRAAEGGARLALLPEYFFAIPGGGPDVAAAHGAAIREALREASLEAGIAVGGNVVEASPTGLANVGVVYDGGRVALEQHKVHPMPREAASGIVGGPAFRAAPVAGHSTGMLVCADILYPEAARVLALQGADVLLNPVMSPWREEDDGREARTAMYVARAYDAGAFVIKAGGFRQAVPGAKPPFAIAGRSLVAAPWGVLARAAADFGEELVFADLDFDRLHAFRERQAQFPARRPEAYEGLL